MILEVLMIVTIKTGPMFWQRKTTERVVTDMNMCELLTDMLETKPEVVSVECRQVKPKCQLLVETDGEGNTYNGKPVPNPGFVYQCGSEQIITRERM